VTPLVIYRWCQYVKNKQGLLLLENTICYKEAFYEPRESVARKVNCPYLRRIIYLVYLGARFCRGEWASKDKWIYYLPRFLFKHEHIYHWFKKNMILYFYVILYWYIWTNRSPRNSFVIKIVLGISHGGKDEDGLEGKHLVLNPMGCF
jgi:hypothetical protein